MIWSLILHTFSHHAKCQRWSIFQATVTQLCTACVCVCCQYSTLGGQRVYCSTLLHFTLFFHWDRRSFTLEILIDLSGYKSLVCVPVYLCVWVYMCLLSNIVLCVKEAKDQILLSISILYNIKPLWSHTQNLTLSKNNPASLSHFIP